jgi:hypothetical protein
MFFIFSLSPEVVIIESKFENESLKPSSIALFLLKLRSNDDEILISVTLKFFACKKLVEKIIINRRNEIKNIYSFCNLKNLFIICIIYTNEKTKIYL